MIFAFVLQMLDRVVRLQLEKSDFFRGNRKILGVQCDVVGECINIHLGMEEREFSKQIQFAVPLRLYCAIEYQTKLQTAIHESANVAGGVTRLSPHEKLKVLEILNQIEN